MMNRSLRTGLRVAGRSNGLASITRAFSSTPHHNLRAIFSDTENADLNKHLHHIQEKIILPAYLPEKQRRIVFDEAKRGYLRENPIVIEVDGYEHKFETINRFSEIENSKEVMFAAIYAMKSADDWENLPVLLAGYRKAGIKLTPDHKGRVVRVATQQGRIGPLLEAAINANKTGLHIMNKELLVRFMLGINAHVTDDLDDMKLALKRTDTILDLIQRREHSDRWMAPNTGDKATFSLMARGMMLYTRASVVKAKKAAEEDITKDLVLLKDEAEFVQALWKNKYTQVFEEVSELRELNPTFDRVRKADYAAAKRAARGKKERMPQDHGVRGLNSQAYNDGLHQGAEGMRVAREVLGEEFEGLLPVADAIEAHLTKFHAAQEQAKSSS